MDVVEEDVVEGYTSRPPQMREDVSVPHRMLDVDGDSFLFPSPICYLLDHLSIVPVKSGSWWCTHLAVASFG